MNIGSFESSIKILLGETRGKLDNKFTTKEIKALFGVVVIPEIRSDTKWIMGIKKDGDVLSKGYNDLLKHFKKIYRKIDRSGENGEENMKVFHDNLKLIRNKIVVLIKESYELFLSAKFPSVSEHYTFYRFRKIDYEKYSLKQLFRTLLRYVALQTDDRTSRFFVDMEVYAREAISNVNDMKETFPGGNVGVENETFSEYMSEFFSKVGDQDNPFRHQDIIEAYMTYHNFIGNQEMKSHGLLLHHGLGSGKTRTSTKVLKACMYDTERHFESHLNEGGDGDVNPSFIRNTFIMVPAALRSDPWYLHLLRKEYGCPFPETVDTEYDLPIHNIFMIHYNYGMKDRVSSVTTFLERYNKYLENSFIIVDEVHNMLNSVPDIEQGERVRRVMDESSNRGTDYRDSSDRGSVKKTTFYHTLYNTLQGIKNKKIILLSGTPISKYVSEYIYALRLVKGSDYFDSLDRKKFSFETGSIGSVFDFTIPSEDGSISYMNSLFTKDSEVQTYKLAMDTLDNLTYSPGDVIENPTILSPILSVPKKFQTKISSKKEFTAWKDGMVRVYNQIHAKSNVFIKNLLDLSSGLVSFMKGNEIDKINRTYRFIPMTNLQIKIYNAVQATQEKEIPEKKRMEVLMSQLRRKQAVNARGTLKFALTAEIDKLTRQQCLPGSGTKNSGVLTSLLELCNIAYINDDIDNVKGSGSIRPHDIMVSIGDGSRHQFKTVSDFKTHLRSTGRGLTLDNLPIYSNKLAQLLVDLENNPNENAVSTYHNINPQTPISRCHIVYSPYVNIYGIESIRQMFEDTGLYDEYKPVKKGEFIFPSTKSQRFAVYEPGIQTIFNDPRNAFGEYIKVLLISDNAKEGVSFRNVAYEHIFNFQWNPNKIDQIIGRGIRQNSHNDLVGHNAWNDLSKVQVFYYCSILSKRYPKCMDVDVGRVGKQKYELIQYFYETIHKNSLDSGVYES